MKKLAFLLVALLFVCPLTFSATGCSNPAGQTGTAVGDNEDEPEDEPEDSEGEEAAGDSADEPE